MIRVHDNRTPRALVAALCVAAVFYTVSLALGAAAPTLTDIDPAPTIEAGPVVNLSDDEYAATIPSIGVGEQTAVMAVGDGTVFDDAGAFSKACFQVSPGACFKLTQASTQWAGNDEDAHADVYVYDVPCTKTLPTLTSDAGAYYYRFAAIGTAADTFGGVSAQPATPPVFCAGGGAATGISVSITLNAEASTTATVQTVLTLERTR